MFKIVVRLILVFVVTSTATQVWAERVTTHAFGCISEEVYEEYGNLVANKRGSQVNQLVNSGQCLLLKEGSMVSVIKRGFTVTAIRYNGVKLYIDAAFVK